MVNVYKETGGFILSFGEGLFTYATASHLLRMDAF